MEQQTLQETEASKPLNTTEASVNEKKLLQDIESSTIKEKVKFPWIVLLIIFNEFCERFSYSGLKAFLTLYLKQKLLYTEDEATEVYHLFTAAAYMFPVVGAILADVYIGKFKTILYLMVVYVTGNIVLALTAIPPLYIPGRTFTLIGLFLVALGTGGIKPCVSAFGGDQFHLPAQEKQLTTFFSLLYMSLCSASFFSKTISPLLRSEISCFGDKDCFSVAFAAPGFLIIVSIVLFQCGKKYYIIKKPTGNVLVDVVKCICTALKAPKTNEISKKPKHWLDRASCKYDSVFIEDVKRTLRVFLLFIPTMVFWALVDQMGSRWTLQATRMDGEFKYFTIRPDQMQVLNPISIFIMIPLFRTIIYPTLARCNILTNLLHRIIVGFSLAAVSFACAGVMESRLENEYPVSTGPGIGHIRIFNGFHDCELHLSNDFHSIHVEPQGVYVNESIEVHHSSEMFYNRILQCNKKNYTISNEAFFVEEKKSFSYFYKASENDTVEKVQYLDKGDKSKSGFPLARILINSIDEQETVDLFNRRLQTSEFTTNSSFNNLTDVYSSEYDLYVNTERLLTDTRLKTGGIYTILVDLHSSNYSAKVVTVSPPNSVSMIWMMPQMFIISVGELLVAISGLEFAFKQAPESMKAVLQAYLLFVEAFGNILIITVTMLGSGHSPASQNFFYSGLMALATVTFTLLARRHEKVDEVITNETEMKLMQKTYLEIEEVAGH